MKYNLPRQVSQLDLTPIIKREIEKQNISLNSLTKKHQGELATIVEVIKTIGLPDYLILHKLPHNLGKGIFLHPDKEPLSRGRLIVPYSGEKEIVPAEYEGGHYAFTPLEKIYLSKEEQFFLNNSLTYKARRSYTLKIDASKKGNFARFVNHSSSPYLAPRLCRVPKNSFGLKPTPIEVIYFVSKKILPGQQLLVCYEGEENCYWNEEGVKPFPMNPSTFQLNSHRKIISQN